MLITSEISGIPVISSRLKTIFGFCSKLEQIAQNKISQKNCFKDTCDHVFITSDKPIN